MIRRVAQSLAVIVVMGLVLAGSYYFYVQRQPVCEICYRPLHAATFYRILLADQQSVDVCCPRCGLRFQSGREDIVGTEVADFDSGERFDSAQAYFVENSAVHLCCPAGSLQRKDRSGSQFSLAWDRCLPSLVAFKSQDRAKAFISEFGGRLKSYHDLIQEEGE